MAVKIIKPGQKEFYGFCDRCGCEFTYELDDLKLTGKVECPTCNKTYYHPACVQNSSIPKDIGLKDISWPIESIPCGPMDTSQTDPCAGCGWKEHLRQNGIYIGDSPCTWCNKNRFNTISSSSPITGGKVTQAVELNSEIGMQKVYDSCGCPNSQLACSISSTDYSVEAHGRTEASNSFQKPLKSGTKQNVRLTH